MKETLGTPTYDADLAKRSPAEEFREYFKLAIELKLGSGMRNIHYTKAGEETKFDNAIESLKSRVWTLSFTFEGFDQSERLDLGFCLGMPLLRSLALLHVIGLALHAVCLLLDWPWTQLLHHVGTA